MDDIDHLTPIERVLARLMSDLNEDAYAAGWLGGCEYDIWRRIVRGPEKWGQLSPEELAPRLEEIRVVATTAHRWIVWSDKTQRPEAVRLVEDWFPMFDASPSGRTA